MLIDRRRFSEHRIWILITLVATGLAAAWYVASARGEARWPGGSSPVGFAYGVIGGGIIAFEFLLWPRKKLRTVRIGRRATRSIWRRVRVLLSSGSSIKPGSADVAALAGGFGASSSFD